MLIIKYCEHSFLYNARILRLYNTINKYTCTDNHVFFNTDNHSIHIFSDHSLNEMTKNKREILLTYFPESAVFQPEQNAKFSRSVIHQSTEMQSERAMYKYQKGN